MNISRSKTSTSFLYAILFGTLLFIGVRAALGQEVNTKNLAFPPCVAVTAPQARIPGVVSRIWNQNSKLWPQHDVLEVTFLGGTERQKNEAWKRFQVVDNLVNLTFVKSTSPSAPIRVDFKNSGHWSYLGRDALTIRAGRQTMNLQLMAGVFGDGKAEWDRVGIHEVLHAIGMEHEHQHPDSANLIWNEAAVYDYYGRTQGWSKTQIRQQVLNRYRGGNWTGTTFDPASIMEYPIPPGLANIVVGWNDKMSAKDIAYLKKIYPPRK